MHGFVSWQAVSAVYHGCSATDHNQRPKFVPMTTAEDRGCRYPSQSIPKFQIATMLVHVPKAPNYYLGVFSAVSWHHAQSDICSATSAKAQHERPVTLFYYVDVSRGWVYAMSVSES